jgi:hypothetical protein
MTIELDRINLVAWVLVNCPIVHIMAGMNVLVFFFNTIVNVVNSIYAAICCFLKGRVGKIIYHSSITYDFIRGCTGGISFSIRYLLQFFTKTISIIYPNFRYLCWSIVFSFSLVSDPANARCVNLPSLDLSQDVVLKEVSDFFSGGKILTHPRKAKPKTNEIDVYIVSYRSILDSEFGRSLQDEILKISSSFAIKTCSTLSVNLLNYGLSSESDRLNISRLLLKESTIIFMISSAQDYNAAHGGEVFGHVYGPPIIESEDVYNSVSVSLFRTTFQRNQYLAIVKSSGIPSIRFENLRLSRSIERVFNLSNGCGWHQSGFCAARDEVWEFMFNEKVFKKDYWKDILSFYHQRAQDGELER